MVLETWESIDDAEGASVRTHGFGLGHVDDTHDKDIERMVENWMEEEAAEWGLVRQVVVWGSGLVLEESVLGKCLVLELSEREQR